MCEFSGINTFGSHILLGATLPVIVVAPFTLYFMFPSLAGNKLNPDKDMRRGEVLLYERETSLLATAFTVSAKYMLFHGFRVSRLIVELNSIITIAS